MSLCWRKGNLTLHIESGLRPEDAYGRGTTNHRYTERIREAKGCCKQTEVVCITGSNNTIAAARTYGHIEIIMIRLFGRRRIRRLNSELLEAIGNRERTDRMIRHWITLFICNRARYGNGLVCGRFDRAYTNARASTNNFYHFICFSRKA